MERDDEINLSERPIHRKPWRLGESKNTYTEILDADLGLVGKVYGHRINHEILAEEIVSAINASCRPIKFGSLPPSHL